MWEINHTTYLGLLNDFLHESKRCINKKGTNIGGPGSPGANIIMPNTINHAKLNKFFLN